MACPKISALLKACCIAGALLATGPAHGQDWRKALEEQGVTLELNEQAEIWTNFAGGVRRGVTFNGLLTGSIELDLAKLAGIPNSRFYASMFQIHGRQPSLDMVGTLQPVSNIEATGATRLYAAWFETLLFNERLSLRIGQQGANEEFMTSKYSGFFLNSSFGYPALAALNLPSGGANYPLATPMARANLKVTENVSLVGAVFNGDPAGPGDGDPQRRDRTGTSFRVRDNPLYFLELWIDRNQGLADTGLPGTLKLGVWHHTGIFTGQRFDAQGGLLAVTGAAPTVHHGNTAFYALFDQMVWRRPGTSDQGLGIYALIMRAPSDRNLSDLYAEWGASIKGPFESRPDDQFGLGFSLLKTGRSLRSFYNDGFAGGMGQVPIKPYELSVELSYRYVHSDMLTVQPSLQYTRNPAARLPLPATYDQQRNLRDAWTFGLRTTLTF
ncbi:porin [Beijerinckia sp. GAS462]|nr:porin [Beijerinckia sp. GAS462]SEC55822.1 porin, OprB family [Beijerinckia sp. 28-YEA-48]